MGRAKKIRVEPISSRDAIAAVKRWHYSGRVVRNSQLHLGVFLDGRLLGAMSFGPSMDKRKILPLVEGTAWNGAIELNRMAFSDELPRNSESRALAISVRMLREHAPHVEWVVSFADATQSGDGAIYRAAGWLLTSIKPNTQILEFPDGSRISKMTVTCSQGSRRIACERYGLTNDGRAGLSLFIKQGGARLLPGFQLRYIGFVNRSARERLIAPVLDYSEVERAGARMFRGVRAGSIDSDVPGDQPGEGGAVPTPALIDPA